MPPVPPGAREHPRRQRPCARPRRDRGGAGGPRPRSAAHGPRHPRREIGRPASAHRLRLVVAARDQLESAQIAEPRRRLDGLLERAVAQTLGDGLVDRRRLEGSTDVLHMRVGRSLRIAQHLEQPTRSVGRPARGASRWRHGAPADRDRRAWPAVRERVRRRPRAAPRSCSTRRRPADRAPTRPRSADAASSPPPRRRPGLRRAGVSPARRERR